MNFALGSPRMEESRTGGGYGIGPLDENYNIA